MSRPSYASQMVAGIAKVWVSYPPGQDMPIHHVLYTKVRENATTYDVKPSIFGPRFNTCAVNSLGTLVEKGFITVDFKQMTLQITVKGHDKLQIIEEEAQLQITEHEAQHGGNMTEKAKLATYFRVSGRQIGPVKALTKAELKRHLKREVGQLRGLNDELDRENTQLKDQLVALRKESGYPEFDRELPESVGRRMEELDAGRVFVPRTPKKKARSEEPPTPESLPSSYVRRRPVPPPTSPSPRVAEAMDVDEDEDEHSIPRMHSGLLFRSDSAMSIDHAGNSHAPDTLEYDDLRLQLQTAQRDLAAEVSRREKCEAEITRLETERDQAADALENLKDDLAVCHLALDACDQHIDDLEEGKVVLQDRLRAAETLLLRARVDGEQQVARARVEGRLSALEVLDRARLEIQNP
ncbi:hypothetical protein C8R46DRAFT_31184 [Mycena filopes]|nr:hypothetical protein C8R46DRAFT_31184 [Mycena filopes]